jgi:hypothetical protein
MKTKHKMKELGILSLIFSLISLCFFPFIALFNIQFQTIYVHLMVLGLAILSIGLGLISYHSEKKISFGFYGFVIGIVALLIIGFIFLIDIIGFLTL